ncbi:MAG TPA: hypothetical protein VNZ03_01215 [Terriglobales bacterium]|jgi:hypothetical protein|nr:hypothetical protein [Terriglobales bacterium]
MSFDLYFCWRKPERMNFEEVSAWAKGIEYFARKDAQLWYLNPKTGVYFSFDFAAEAPDSPEDGPDIPNGYFDSGLSFNLNYNRPSYFAFEAMPIVEKLATRFGLGVVNPQGEAEGPESVAAANIEGLTQSWVHHNQRAILVMIEQPNFSRPLTMPAAASLYLWRYGKAKEDLERTCGEGVFVPSLVPVQRKGDMKAGRATVYTEGLPTIIPECEWVFIVRRKKAFFRSKKDVAAISGQTFREVLTGHIKSFHWQDPNVQIIDTESAEKAGKMISAIDHTLPRSEFEVIGTDSYVDIELP